jgi:hypothetical protein
MATREQLYAKFGITAEAAQLLETELGTLLLAQCGLENRLWDKSKCLEAAQTLQGINKNTLGRVLRKVREKSKIAADLEAALSDGLRIRNRLFHSFYRDHGTRMQTDEGRDLMMTDLEEMHEKIFRAYQLAGAMSTLAIEFVLRLKAENA